MFDINLNLHCEPPTSLDERIKFLLYCVRTTFPKNFPHLHGDVLFTMADDADRSATMAVSVFNVLTSRATSSNFIVVLAFNKNKLIS